MKGITALVDEKTLETDRGGNEEGWDSAESTKIDRKTTIKQLWPVKNWVAGLIGNKNDWMISALKQKLNAFGKKGPPQADEP